MPKVEKIRSLNLPDPQGPVQACSGKALPFTDIVDFITSERAQSFRHAVIEKRKEKYRRARSQVFAAVELNSALWVIMQRGVV